MPCNLDYSMARMITYEEFMDKPLVKWAIENNCLPQWCEYHISTNYSIQLFNLYEFIKFNSIENKKFKNILKVKNIYNCL